MAGKIFINYRRGDDPGNTGRLFDRLQEAFRPDQLFMDVDSIKPGLDFVKVLEEQVSQCDVVLAVIGRDWVQARDEAGDRRLDNPEDFVRIEIASALAGGKLVIPVLVGEARMPRSDELPEPIKPLARRHAVRLTHERFRADMQGLVKALQEVLEEADALRRADAQAAQQLAMDARLEAAAMQRAEAEGKSQETKAELRRQREISGNVLKTEHRSDKQRQRAWMLAALGVVVVISVAALIVVGGRPETSLSTAVLPAVPVPPAPTAAVPTPPAAAVPPRPAPAVPTRPAAAVPPRPAQAAPPPPVATPPPTVTPVSAPAYPAWAERLRLSTVAPSFLSASSCAGNIVDRSAPNCEPLEFVCVKDITSLTGKTVGVTPALSWVPGRFGAKAAVIAPAEIYAALQIRVISCVAGPR